MASRVLSASVVTSLTIRCLTTSEVEGLPEELLNDESECRATGFYEKPSECSLNALQRAALKQNTDMESSEGAAAVEASRALYASYFEKVSHGDEHKSNSSGSCAEYGCRGYTPGNSCQCNRACRKYNSCCDDFASHCGGGQGGGQQHQNNGMSTSTRDGIPPPSTPFEFNGKSWSEITISGEPGKEMHFFAIGDWGGLDGALNPPDNFPRMIVYPGGHTPGPHVFPRSRLRCSHTPLVNCYFKGKKYCNPACGFAEGIDDQAQLLVAEQFKKRAALHDPQFILNVGDNFYWGGIAKECGYPMSKIHPATQHQFQTIFEQIYAGPGIDGKPWLSVLGNHDWGGRQFTAGWDQQIAYTWASDRWRLPAAYWHQRINFPDYKVDVYLVDSNYNDAEWKNLDPEHNICGAFHNPSGASCAHAGGPGSVDTCPQWFKSLWEKEKTWLDDQLSASDADWQIAVTHFPCDSAPRFWRGLHERRGLDLLVTGHRHDQELWKANQPGYKGILGGLTCFVTGGGGGITSEESVIPGTPTHHWPNVETQYGFFDMTISKEQIKVESIDYKGDVTDTTVVYPK